MNTDKTAFEGKQSRVTGAILKAYYDVCNELGSGFIESVYEAASIAALPEVGLDVARQVPIPVYFHGNVVAEFRADSIVERVVLVELKAIQALDRAHHMQVLNYLKATPIEVALLLNFGTKPEFKRFLLDNDQKKIRVPPCESVVSPQSVSSV